ncbi:MAG: hypothetical protein ACOX6U_10465 [Oscillospiraceae bacterium]|jgi:hypothetical protein
MKSAEFEAFEREIARIFQRLWREKQVSLEEIHTATGVPRTILKKMSDGIVPGHTTVKDLDRISEYFDNYEIGKLIVRLFKDDTDYSKQEG